jgi:phytoene dehydrogenase-like protein
VTRTAAEYERYDANYIGGDINGGVQDLLQTVFRPALRWSQHATPTRGIYLCSSSTPPGGGVHGMCGYNAARVALRREFGVASGPIGHDAVLRTALTAGAAPA